MMNRISRLSAFMLASVLALSAARAAGPLDNQVPQDSIIYVGWAGADALQAEYAESNLKKVVEASTARKFISEQLPKLIEQAGQRDPNLPATIAKVQTVLGIAWRHPTAFYFCPVDFTNIQQPDFHFGILCDAGSDGKAVMDLMTETLAQNPPPPQLPIQVRQDGSIISITFGKPDTAEDRRKGGGLAASASYVKAMGHVKQDKPAVAVYVDATQVISMVSDGLNKSPAPPEIKAKVPAIIDSLGVNGLTQIASTSGFDGKGWSSQGFMGVTGPHKGIVTLFSEKPVDNTTLALVPKDAVMFTTGHLDLQKVYNEATSVVGKIDENALKEFQNGVAEVNQMIGMNIEQDIIAPFGDEWTFYRAPNEDVGGISFVFVQKLRDPDRLAKTLATAESVINEKAQGRFKIDKTTTSKIEVSSISFLQFSLAWTVRNGYLYVSSLDGIASAVKQVENKGPSIVENDLYKAAMARMPQGIKPTTIAYSNPAKLYPELRRTLLGLLPIARAAGLDLPADLLPDTSDIAPFLTPGAQVAWWDADGLHTMAKSAFPGSQIIGGNPAQSTTVVAIAGVGTAVMMPSLGRAREMANRSVDLANERGLAMSAVVWAASNNDNMPDHLGRLVLEGDVAAKQLVSKRTDTTALEMNPELEQLAKSDFAKFSQEVDKHCDYVYVGKGLKADSDASIIVIYQKPGPWTSEGIPVAFADSHAEFIRMGPGMEEAFAATNDLLKKKGLPTIDVQDIIKKSSRTAMAAATPPATGPSGR